MSNLRVVFDILDKNQHAPPGYSKTRGHIIFDVCMTLERKARWVKDEHLIPEPNHSNYACVFSHEIFRISLTYADLNHIDVCDCDIKNDYLQSPSSEKHFAICGPEFGLQNVGRRALIIHALYGENLDGADYWQHIRSTMEEMGFKSCTADPD